MPNIIGDRTVGKTCDGELYYYPFVASGLSEPLSGHMAACPNDGNYCAEKLFDSFVEQTANEKLLSAKTLLKQNIALYEANKREW